MPPNEPTVPAGEYTSSCGGCRIQTAPDGITDASAAGQKALFCSDCTKTCGKRIPSSLDLSECKVEDGASIYNSNGQLMCEEPLPSNQENLPVGSFSSSCYGCSVMGSTVTYTACLDGEKARHLSSFDGSECKSIGNNHGKLQCDDGPANPAPLAANDPNLPAGSYSSSCHGCSVTGNILTCAGCKDGDVSSLDISNCRSVANVGGTLHCQDVKNKFYDPSKEATAHSKDAIEQGHENIEQPTAADLHVEASSPTGRRDGEEL